MSTSTTCLALVATKSGDTEVSRSVRLIDVGSSNDQDVLVRVHWSGINYKDVLAASAGGKVARVDELVPGIDLAGEVVEPRSSDLRVGDLVLAHGYGLGVSHHGGFAELASVPSAWIAPLPDGLTTHDAMVVGTAGFTAGLSVLALEGQGVTPKNGPILVTGATGGVGCVAVAILAARGYEVVASTGQVGAGEWLRQLGAAEVIDRAETSKVGRPLASQQWAGVVDSVGGDTLALALSTLRYGGAVAASGNTGGVTLNTTVLPFILRGAKLLGIDSVQQSISDRVDLWHRLAADLRPGDLSLIGQSEIGLSDLVDALDPNIRRRALGRTIVRVAG